MGLVDSNREVGGVMRKSDSGMFVRKTPPIQTYGQTGIKMGRSNPTRCVETKHNHCKLIELDQIHRLAAVEGFKYVARLIGTWVRYASRFRGGERFLGLFSAISWETCTAMFEVVLDNGAKRVEIL